MKPVKGVHQMKKAMALWAMPYIASDHLRPRTALVRTIMQYRLQTHRVGPLPSFIIIGAQRSGTTHLYDLLVRHPNVYPSLIKEVHYFDRHYEKGHEWYRAHFSPDVAESADKISGARITGEATPCYLFHPFAAKRAATLAPDVKLIVLLRNPVDRAYSQYHLSQEFGWEPLSFEEAIDREPLRIEADGFDYYGINRRRFSYLARGHYAEQLERWKNEFPQEQMQILQAEEFYANPLGTLADVVEFLGLPAWRPTQVPKIRKLTSSRIEPETRERLAAYFQPHNDRLFDMIGTEYDWDSPGKTLTLASMPMRQAVG